MLNDCIIVAGGSGTRLWPASSSGRPKQLLNLPPGIPAGVVSRRKTGKGCCFFSVALDRALAVTEDSADGQVVIIAGKKHIDTILEECAKLGPSEQKRLVLIPEPIPRNTAPAIACALVYLDWVSTGSERNILVLSSDTIIRPLNIFKTDVNAAADMAQADKFVTFGTSPQIFETGHKYIRTSKALTIPQDDSQRRKKYEPEIFSVASFRQKPDPKKTKSPPGAHNFFRNTGIYAFSSKLMLAEFRRSSPDVIDPFSKLMAPNDYAYRKRKGIKILEDWDNLETAYKKTQAISFEQAVAEKCRAAVMVKAGFSWINVSSWDEYAALVKNTGAEVYGTEGAAETCFVDSDIPVALCGVEDLIVIVRSGKDGGPPAVLIAKKGETHRVKEIVEKIGAAGRTELL